MSSTSYRPPVRPSTVTAAHARWLLWLPLVAIAVMAALLCVGYAVAATPTEDPDDTELVQLFTVLVSIAIALPVVVVALVLGLAAWRASRQPALRKTATLIAGVLVVQLFTGIATVFFSFPLAIAVLHNAGAALLVLLVTMLNYKVKHLLDVSQRTPANADVPANSYR